MRRRVVIGLATAALVVLAGVARAQGTEPRDPREAQPERPTVATHAFTVSPGIVELEAGAFRQSLGESSSLFSVPLVFKIGLGARAQLDVAPGFLRLTDHGDRGAGLTDLSLALKWRLFDDAPVLGAFALQPSASLATGSVEDGTGIGTWSVSVLMISSHAFGPVAIDVNAGYTRRGGDGTVVSTDATVWAVSAGLDVAGRLGWCAEFFGYPHTTGISGEPSIVGFLTGPSFAIDKSVVVDAGMALDVRKFGATQVYAGVTWNIGRAWGRRPPISQALRGRH